MWNWAEKGERVNILKHPNYMADGKGEDRGTSDKAQRKEKGLGTGNRMIRACGFHQSIMCYRNYTTEGH